MSLGRDAQNEPDPPVRSITKTRKISDPPTRWDSRIVGLQKKITHEKGGVRVGLNYREWAELERISTNREAYIAGYKAGYKAGRDA